ncbi:glycosyltransferase [Labrys monachus]|uniref:Glycosyltransferase involved in cell wall biosynthesis n=1 Tax=Labrys monachus TaxID=217067 RepID=A0ABU0FBH7_9HYPH|nr:glycosyltransferase [Labrys monachus]MDQ0391443.1 glycosyltransferase involved in cell wall biosynthesis [Labrys monachus]
MSDTMILNDATAPVAAQAAAGTKLLFVTGTLHIPQAYGGVEVNTHELAQEVIARGYPASVLCKLSLRDSFGAFRAVANRLRGAQLWTDGKLGYPVHRSLRPWTDLKGLPLPQVAIVQNGNMVRLGKAFRERGIPSIAYLHGLEFVEGKVRWQGEAADLPFQAYIANSEFTARLLEARFGIKAHIIPPVFRPERYRTAAVGRSVTFINPVPVKGVELALSLAELCPEIPFRFVKGWPLSPRELMALKRRVAQLPNVTLMERASDMRPVYSDTRVLLVPSQWQAETWGRVASEAQYSGIPVLASNRGGLPEAVGPGGTILPHDAPAAIWAEALRQLWQEGDCHAEKSAAALAYSRRAAIDLDSQVDAFLSVVGSVLS